MEASTALIESDKKSANLLLEATAAAPGIIAGTGNKTSSASAAPLVCGCSTADG